MPRSPTMPRRRTILRKPTMPRKQTMPHKQTMPRKPTMPRKQTMPHKQAMPHQQIILHSKPANNNRHSKARHSDKCSMYLKTPATLLATRKEAASRVSQPRESKASRPQKNPRIALISWAIHLPKDSPSQLTGNPNKATRFRESSRHNRCLHNSPWLICSKSKHTTSRLRQHKFNYSTKIARLVRRTSKPPFSSRSSNRRSTRPARRNSPLASNYSSNKRHSSNSSRKVSSSSNPHCLVQLESKTRRAVKKSRPAMRLIFSWQKS